MSFFGVSVGGGILANLRHVLGAKFKRRGRRSWQRYFEKEVLPEYSEILEKNAKAFANEGGRSGELSRSIYIGRGGRGRGVAAVSINVKGPAATYAKITNSGGVIRAKNVKNLTIPLTSWQNSLGQKIKRLSEIPDHRTFLIKRDNAKLVMYKEGGTLMTSKYGNTYIKKGTGRVYPIFLLRKATTIKGTHWADRAYDKSKKEFNAIMLKAFERWTKEFGKA